MPRAKNTTGVHEHAKPAPMRRTGGLQPIPTVPGIHTHKLDLRTTPPAEAPAWRTSAPYTCPELRQPTAIAPARMAAFALPSRTGATLRFPDGRIAPITTPITPEQ